MQTVTIDRLEPVLRNLSTRPEPAPDMTELYVRRGYVPDGRGLMVGDRPVEPGTSVRIDDEATLMFTRWLVIPAPARPA
jgi:hypothetical protein